MGLQFMISIIICLSTVTSFVEKFEAQEATKLYKSIIQAFFLLQRYQFWERFVTRHVL